MNLIPILLAGCEWVLGNVTCIVRKKTSHPILVCSNINDLPCAISSSTFLPKSFFYKKSVKVYKG